MGVYTRHHHRPCRLSKTPLLLLVISIILIYGTSVFRDAPRFESQAEEFPYDERPLQASLRRRGVGEPEEYVLQEHVYRDDGLLEVNPDGAHPVFELIQRAEAEWNAKLQRASKTLYDAVAEYTRRYGRLPPKGFEHWWHYVQRHNVQLPDEYDQIYRNIEPFWGMDPIDLQRIQLEWEEHVETFTIGKTSQTSPISLLNHTSESSRVRSGSYQIMTQLKEVEQYIPPFRAVFSPDDNPNLLSDYELMQHALAAAREGNFIDINNPFPVKLQGWAAACDPNSPARRHTWAPDDVPPPHKKTFIFNHRAAMDPCQHPSHLLQHGQFLRHSNQGPVPHRTLIPQFSYCATTLHHDIVTAMPDGWVSGPREGEDIPWEERADERLLWRGSNTGMTHKDHSKWQQSQRSRIVDLATKDFNTSVVVLRASEDNKRPVGEGLLMKKSWLAPTLLDIAFAGEPLHCDPPMCKKLKDIFEFRHYQSTKVASNYKYALDVDGNGWSSRFKRLITSNSLVFKSTIYPEWFTDRIAPWVHYVPVQNDLSDLFDTLIFFRGEQNGISGHDNMARKIAMAGRKWSSTFWREEDMTAYVFRLFLEYSRVMSLDRKNMNYGEINDWNDNEDEDDEDE